VSALPPEAAATVADHRVR